MDGTISWQRAEMNSLQRVEQRSLETSSAAVKLLRDSPLVILCGGLGTRLREETEWKPKPMVPVGEHPLVWHIMQYYACFGVRRFVLCLGYKGEVIRDFFMSFHPERRDFKIDPATNDITYVADGYLGDEWEVVLANAGLETDTAGRIDAVRPYLNSPNFMMTYGDGLADVNLNALAECHLRNGRLGTVTAVQPISRFAELTIGNENVHAFAEKPAQTDRWVSGGFFVFDKEALGYIDCDEPFEHAPLRKMAEDGQLAAYRHHGFWQCVDTYRELVYVENLWQAKQAPWKKW